MASIPIHIDEHGNDATTTAYNNNDEHWTHIFNTIDIIPRSLGQLALFQKPFNAKKLVF